MSVVFSKFIKAQNHKLQKRIIHNQNELFITKGVYMLRYSAQMKRLV